MILPISTKAGRTYQIDYASVKHLKTLYLPPEKVDENNVHDQIR